MAQLTAGLQNLQQQLDRAFPNRKKPDGWIGDKAHRARISGHNPDDTPGSKPAWDGDPDTMAEVRALDVDIALGDGVTAQALVDHVRELPGLSAVIRYIIFNHRVYHVRNGFGPASFDGDPHTDHIHFEGAWSQTADRDTTFDYHFERIPMALTADDKSWIAAEIGRQLKTFGAGDGDTSPRVYSRDGLATTTEQDTKQIRATLARIEEKLFPTA